MAYVCKTPYGRKWYTAYENPCCRRDPRLATKNLVSDGNVHGSQKAKELIKNFKADCLIADKGYDNNTIVDFARNNGIKVAIPYRSSAKNPRNYDKEFYTTFS